MSEHKLEIEVQELANAVQEIRTACNLIEHIIQQSLIKANEDERNNASVNSES